MDVSVEVRPAPEPEPAPEGVALEQMMKWTEMATLPNDSGDQPKGSRFPCKKRVNEKLYVWVGPIWKCATDCIVNTTSENFAERSGVSGGIFKMAGPGLQAECATMEGCRTGEAKLTGAYELPCKAVIHTVGPKYNIKYRTAAENALHHCYFHCLEEMVEEGHRSIAFSVVNTDKKGYPREEAAHIVIRTVRRFLERYGNKVDALSFVFATVAEKAAYDTVLPLYFPRNKDEQYRAVPLLPADVGNEHGETVVAERQVRVGESFKGAASGGGGAAALPPPTGYEHDEWLEPEQDPTQGVAVGRDGAGVPAGPELARYAQLLEQARSSSLEGIEARRILYRAGKDSTGLPVFVVVTRHIELESVELEELLLHMIRTMDGDVADEMGYTMVLCYTDVTDDNVPPLAWVREVYDLLPRKFKKNLKHLHVVHPSFLMKVMTWFLQVFISPKFFNKVRPRSAPLFPRSLCRWCHHDISCGSSACCKALKHCVLAHAVG